MDTLDRIQELCKKNRISISQLEKTLGFGNGSLAKHRGKNMKSDRLQSIANYFGVSPEFLLTGEEVDWNPATQEIEKKDSDLEQKQKFIQTAIEASSRRFNLSEDEKQDLYIRILEADAKGQSVNIKVIDSIAYMITKNRFSYKDKMFGKYISYDAGPKEEPFFLNELSADNDIEDDFIDLSEVDDINTIFQLIDKYRKASPDTQKAVNAILGIEIKEAVKVEN